MKPLFLKETIMGFGYNEKTNWYDQYFEAGITLPSTSNDTCETALAVGNHHGSLVVRATVSATVSNATIPAGSSVTFNPLFCDTVDGEYVSPTPNYAVSITAPSGAAEVVSSSDELCSFLLPDSDMDYCKIKITTSGAATGKIDVALGYTAR
jgi:hypothetical protein